MELLKMNMSPAGFKPVALCVRRSRHNDYTNETPLVAEISKYKKQLLLDLKNVTYLIMSFKPG